MNVINITYVKYYGNGFYETVEDMLRCFTGGILPGVRTLFMHKLVSFEMNPSHQGKRNINLFVRSNTPSMTGHRTHSF